ncbi:ABC transporter ATP-binding protein [Kiloniella laminariae]|uniref:ABC transporter ATP-binding protein n=1 Tax=Kiloniella laminariae TaxID=454162 RepID=UPI000382B9BF|nr:ABC transporter ATP-binding protein [Kiloniella laminariae]
MSVFLEIENLSVSYGAVRVLHGTSLSVEKGELVALLGASGCGKTTLLRTISGFIEAEKGQVRLEGEDITFQPPEKRDTAMVFQSYALWPHMTAFENIAYGLKLRKKSKPEITKTVSETLELLGLSEFGDRLVANLSGGQRQRVALGRALAVNPSLLLLDEPLSNLDARIRQHVRHEIKAIQNRLGITAVMVTHDREEAMVMADRIVVMNKGKIEQIGSPEELYNHPATAFVADFMGADNQIAVEWRKDKNGCQISSVYGEPVALKPGEESGLSAPTGKGKLFFRSEAAMLVEAGAQPAEKCFLLKGKVEQITYPGGFYRHAVRVGEQTFLVDHETAFAQDTLVHLQIPTHRVHLFAA